VVAILMAQPRLCAARAGKERAVLLAEYKSLGGNVSDAKTGVLITGQTGKGKTSGAGRLLAKAYLRAGFGGLVLCTKIDEADLWRKYLRETGRETDGIFFGQNKDHSFNFLSYESVASGPDLEENLVNLMVEVVRITNPQGKGGGCRSIRNPTSAEDAVDV
jgi:hypothetical protein